ncbi:1-acyl-sn-glycerol-3-phosphate acyltransferase [Roseobacter fucihabitans]|uniref:1-acyl-sn-glycerol-3-phosphate acyltransferase n=1 Tax=Roseobacter fucihabitans TaxID=1537242 RepID=UPI0038677283
MANHPTGIADGIILHWLLAAKRPDTCFFTNSDILRILPQMEDMIAAVEWRVNRRSHAKTRATMAHTKQAVEAGWLGVIFPSARPAKRRGLQLH